MQRSLMIRSLVATAVLLAAACGGALAPEDVDTSSSSSSSTSSGGTKPPPPQGGSSGFSGSSGSSGSSGGFPIRDSGVVIVDASLPTRSGFVNCPDAATTCTTSSFGGAPLVCCIRKKVLFSCEKSGDTCQDGDVIGCDENADCLTGVCCAAPGGGPIGSNFRFVTACGPTCITNYPREQVCTSDADCPGQTCREWNCGGYNHHGVKTCAPLGACD